MTPTMTQGDGEPGALTCRVSRLHDRDVVELTGDIDLATVPELEATLSSLTAPTVIIDLCGVTFMDSVGIHALIDHHRRLEEGHRMRLVYTPESIVARILALTRIDQTLETDACASGGGEAHESPLS